MKAVQPLADPGQAVEEALSHPIGTPRLEEIIQKKESRLAVCWWR